MTVVRRAETESEREKALAIRHEVFVEEQGVPEELEIDGKDDEAIHFVAHAETASSEDDDAEPRDSDSGSDPHTDPGSNPDSDPEAIGTVRLRDLGGVGKVERMAVLQAYRGEGVGQQLMAAVESAAEERDLSTLRMHAQQPAEGFYRMLGYEATSDAFEEAGIVHVEMEKSLD